MDRGLLVCWIKPLNLNLKRKGGNFRVLLYNDRLQRLLVRLKLVPLSHSILPRLVNPDQLSLHPLHHPQLLVRSNLVLPSYLLLHARLFLKPQRPRERGKNRLELDWKG